MATASGIFKIRAVADFLAPKDPDADSLLSFRRTQAFYVLSTDTVKGLYFVSTQYATPFSRTAVSGLVPISHFEVVDLLSKDPSPAKTQAAAAPAAAPETQQTRENAVKTHYSHLQANSRRYSEGARLLPPPVEAGPPRAGTLPRNLMAYRGGKGNADAHAAKEAAPPLPPKANIVPAGLVDIANDPIRRAEIVSTVRLSQYSSSHFASRPPHQNLAYTIRVKRQSSTHIITRTFDDFIILHNSLCQFFGAHADLRHLIPPFPTPITSSSATNANQLEERIQEQQLQLDQYVAQLCHALPTSMLESGIVAKFFAPRTREEAENLQRNGPCKDSVDHTRREMEVKSRRPASPHPGPKRTNRTVTSPTADTHYRASSPTAVPPRSRPHRIQSPTAADNLTSHLQSKLSLSPASKRCSNSNGAPHSAGSDFDAEDFLDAYVARTPVY